VGAHGLARAGRIVGGDGLQDAAVVLQRFLAQFLGLEVFFQLVPQAAALAPTGSS
jgi:hypothetical protein